MSTFNRTCLQGDNPRLVLINGKRRKVVDRKCPDCGVVKAVRADTSIRYCRRCSGRVAGRTLKPRMVKGSHRDCGWCGGSYFWRPSDDIKNRSRRRFCSRACANGAKRKYQKEARGCKTCGRQFLFSEKPSSNTVGNYCSLQCRNKGYIGTYHGKPAQYPTRHRPGWSSIARKFKKSGNNFCCLCGRTSGRLHVHHLEPYRLRRNNAPSNLVTACPKCHGRIERISERAAELSNDRMNVIIRRVRLVLDRLWMRNKPVGLECKLVS